MKKRTLKVLLIVLPMIMILMACGCPSCQKNKIRQLTSEEIAEKYKNVPLDPYGYCDETNSFIILHQGIYLVRDGVHYSLNELTGKKERPEYNAGKMTAGDGQYLYQRAPGRKGDDNGLFVYQLGDFDPLVLNKETDEIRSYGVSSVKLIKLEDLKYGLQRELQTDVWGLTGKNIKTTEGSVKVPNDCKEFQYTLNGEVLDCIYNLEKDTEVTVSWYEGTTYHEYTCVADLKYYYAYDKDTHSKMGDDSSGPIEFEGELHKEGYATYDFTNVEPGTYLVISTEINSENAYRGGAVLIIE